MSDDNETTQVLRSKLRNRQIIFYKAVKWISKQQQHCAIDELLDVTILQIFDLKQNSNNLMKTRLADILSQIVFYYEGSEIDTNIYF